MDRPKKRISAKELAFHIKSGLSLEEIKAKYALTDELLHRFIGKLVENKLILPQDIREQPKSNKLVSGKKQIDSLITCPNCGLPQCRGDTYCKDCGLKLDEPTPRPQHGAPHRKSRETNYEDDTHERNVSSIYRSGIAVFAFLVLVGLGWGAVKLFIKPYSSEGDMHSSEKVEHAPDTSPREDDPNSGNPKQGVDLGGPAKQSKERENLEKSRQEYRNRQQEKEATAVLRLKLKKEAATRKTRTEELREAREYDKKRLRRMMEYSERARQRDYGEERRAEQKAASRKTPTAGNSHVQEPPVSRRPRSGGETSRSSYSERTTAKITTYCNCCIEPSVGPGWLVTLPVEECSRQGGVCNKGRCRTE